MKLAARIGCALCLGMLALPSLLWSQAVCRASDSTGTAFRKEILKYSNPRITGNAAVRDSLRLGSADSTGLIFVSQETVCKKANATYQSALGVRSNATAFSGRVYVLQAGTTYAVLDPDYHLDGRTKNWIIVIMDSRYKKLSLF